MSSVSGRHHVAQDRAATRSECRDEGPRSITPLLQGGVVAIRMRWCRAMHSDGRVLHPGLIGGWIRLYERLHVVTARKAGRRPSLPLRVWYTMRGRPATTTRGEAHLYLPARQQLAGVQPTRSDRSELCKSRGFIGKSDRQQGRAERNTAMFEMPRRRLLTADRAGIGARAEWENVSFCMSMAVFKRDDDVYGGLSVRGHIVVHACRCRFCAAGVWQGIGNRSACRSRPMPFRPIDVPVGIVRARRSRR